MTQERAAPQVTTAALLRLAGPIFVAQVAVMGLSVIDTVMAGRLSATDLAAVALGSAIYGSVFVGGMGVLQALTPIAGQHFGAGRFADIGIDLVQAVWLALLLAALGTPVLVFNRPWLAATGTEPEVARVAAVYLNAVAVGLPAALCSRAFISLNAAVSRPKIAMGVSLAALACKVPLNGLLMYGVGPLPALGGAGCGAATATLMWLMLGAYWLIWRLDPFYARFVPRGAERAYRWPTWARQRELLRLGLPTGATILIEVTSFTFIALLVARLGASTVAGHQIVANLVSVLFMLPLGFGVATSVLVAQSIGAGAPRHARRAALRGMRVGVVAAAIACAAVYLLREQIVAQFTGDANVATVALALLAPAVLFHFFDAVQGVAALTLRGYKVAFAPMLIHSVTLWGIGLIGGYLLAYHPPGGWPYGGALSFWIAATAGLVITAAAMTWLLAVVARRHAVAATS